MVALLRAVVPELVQLRDIQSEELDELLGEEQLAWRSLLHWDFTASAELVRRFLKIHALSGYAARVDGRIVGYAYYVYEEHKGLIGDLFLLREHDTPENEDHLLSAILQDLLAAPDVSRVEAQLMMRKGPFERQLPFPKMGQVYPRILMMADLSAQGSNEEGNTRFLLKPWTEHRHDEAAKLIAAAYQGHVDSFINDQYRSYIGARRFLSNIIQYPGCGSFFARGSFVSENSEGRLNGLILSSLVAQDVGHVTQVCVAPEWKGRGLGQHLMSAALGALREQGAERVSLTVTASNLNAVSLYQRMGFRSTRRFAAYVWEDL